MSISLKINGKTVTANAEPDTPLLWVIRDELGMTGTKFGCGMALCGACTVHLDGQPIRSCSTPLSAAAGNSITTIEGIGSPDVGARVQAAWIQHDVPQCGYCQSGQIMRAAGLLKKNNRPSRNEIKEFMNTNICRCGTYNRIVTAIEKASREG